jgi:starch synthase
MYSQRYGTVPIVRATGGLYDTVKNYSERTGEGTGFRFEEYEPAALVKTVARALKAYARRDDWRTLQRTGMAQDFSWDASAAEYVKVYKRAMKGTA